MKTAEEQKIDEELAKHKVGTSPRLRLGVIMYRGMIQTFGVWIGMVGITTGFDQVTQSQWALLFVALSLSGANDFMNYTSVTWKGTVAAAKELINPPPPPTEVTVENVEHVEHVENVTVEEKKSE